MHYRLPLLLSVLLPAATAPAIVFTATNTFLVAENETVSEESWVVANAAELQGTFTDDLFLAAGTRLLLAGTYESAVWGLAGTEIEFNGRSLHNLRLAASSSIRIDGTVDGNLIAMANTVSIGTNAVITGDALLRGNQVIVEGRIDGSLGIEALRTVTISGTVKGDAAVTSPEIILPDEARILGDLSYTTDRELIPGGDTVAGRLVRILPESPYSAARIRTHLLWFLAALLTGVPLIALFPMTTAMASLLIRKAPFKCLLVGFIAAGALPFFALISLSTAIGMPLGAIVLAAWGILVYVSRIIVGLMIGTQILRTGSTSAGRVLLAMVTGLALIYLLTFIPSAFAGMVQFLVIWMGMGSLLLALLQKRRLIIQVPEELRHLEALKNEKNKSTEEP